MNSMTTASNDSNIGRLLLKRYHLVELVGKGAMGRVYRAEDVLLGGVVAVKFLAQTLLNDKMRDRFKAEARTCAQLGQRSIHIVRVTDYGVSDDDIPFYVMEYLQGEGLSEVISSQTMSLPRFLSLTRQICLGLQCAHEGIVVDGINCPIIHRDIKPSNIVVSREMGMGELAKILDFGIAKLIQSDGAQTSSFMGTLAYSSPEQMEGRELDARSDIYSLGIMMFEMLTGRMPLQAETHSFGSWYKAHHFQQPRSFTAVNPTLKLPRVLEALVMACLAKAPNDRPQSATEVLKALEPLEQRYSGNRHVSNRIGELLAKKQPVPEFVPIESPSIQEVKQATWPSDKPIAQIVFPQALTNGQSTPATLWVMLPQQEIENFKLNRLYNKIYKNFLCTLSPHPMVLWITGIHNKFLNRDEPRWLRCFLDLKTQLGQEMIRLMSEKGEYQVLLFALEDPQHCAHVITVQVHPAQCRLFREWAITSQTWTSIGSPTMSKSLLQTEFDKLKAKVAAEMSGPSSN